MVATALPYFKNGDHLKVRTRFEMSPEVALREMSPETVFVCPGHELWQHWVKKYNIGYTYAVNWNTTESSVVIAARDLGKWAWPRFSELNLSRPWFWQSRPLYLYRDKQIDSQSCGAME